MTVSSLISEFDGVLQKSLDTQLVQCCVLGHISLVVSGIATVGECWNLSFPAWLCRFAFTVTNPLFFMGSLYARCRHVLWTGQALCGPGATPGSRLYDCVSADSTCLSGLLWRQFSPFRSAECRAQYALPAVTCSVSEATPRNGTRRACTGPSLQHGLLADWPLCNS